LKVTEKLLAYFAAEKETDESFNTFVRRVGIPRLRELTASLQHVPSFQEDPSFFEDYGHEHERFAVRKGIKGECAGSTVAERIPVIDSAHDWLAQAAAYIYHKEYSHAVIAAYEAAAAAARVPLYQRLVDPFTSTEALWEFENLLVLTGDTQGQWQGISTNFERLRASGLDTPGEESAREILNESSGLVDYISRLELKVARNVA
jgi:hypothetical protein